MPVAKEENVRGSLHHWSSVKTRSREGYRMVFASICEHASTASFFASTSMQLSNLSCEQRAL